MRKLRKTLLKAFKWLLIICLSLITTVVAFMTFHPTFGGKPNADSRAKMNASSHYNGDIFINLQPTSTQLKDIPIKDDEPKNGVLSIFFPPKGKRPSEPLPTEAMDKVALQNGDFIWQGHSTVLFKIDNSVILTDPVYHNASPVPFTVEPYAMTNPPTIDNLPMIDAVLISHDHYDHLDYRAIRKMNDKVKHFYVPLGVKAHLQRWGIADDKVTEFDWYEQATIGHIELIFTPSRHFSGRNFTTRNTTLWGSWVVKSPSVSLFFSGDSGYGKHFAEIGERFGPFDIALMEDGQYNERWEDVHMLPEQTAKATKDLKAKRVLPVHWGKFDLSLHTWKAPIERFLRAAEHDDFTVLTPKIGQRFVLNAPPTSAQAHWWEAVK